MKGTNSLPEQCLHGMYGAPFTLLVINRSIALDEKEYDEPLRYNPDRFLNKDLNNALLGHPHGHPAPHHKIQIDQILTTPIHPKMSTESYLPQMVQAKRTSPYPPWTLATSGSPNANSSTPATKKTVHKAPSLSFFLAHPSGTKIVYNLGIHKDWCGYPRAFVIRVENGIPKIDVLKDIKDRVICRGY
jgi:hypothetical protein